MWAYAALTLMSSAAVGLQIGRPVSDISVNAWLPSTPATSLFSMLDEIEASDADFIYVESGSTCEVQLTSLLAPGAGANHVLRYRTRCDPGKALTVSLRMGAANQIASWAHNPGPATVTLYEQVLSSGEIALITDYTDLRVRMVST